MAIPLSQIDPKKIGVKAQSVAPEQPQQSFSIGKTLSNIPKSAGQMLGGIGSAIVHPMDTLGAVGGLAAGAVEKVLPGDQGIDTSSIDALGQFYKERYGGVQNILQTIQEDPVGFAADAASILSGGGAAVSKLGTVSKIGTLAKAGSIATKVGDIVDPLRAVQNVAGGVKSVTSTIKNKLPQAPFEGFVESTKAAKVVPPPNMQSALPDITKDLTKGTFRLTQKEEVALGKQLEDITDAAVRYKINGSPTVRVEKVNSFIDSMESTLSKTLKNVAGSAKTENIVNDLENLKSVYQNHFDFPDISAQIDKSIATLQAKGKGIKYADLNDFKRSAWNTAYSKGDKVIDEIRHAVGDVVNQRIITDLNGLGIPATAKNITVPIEAFNAEYGKLLKLKKVLKIAEARPQISGVQSRLAGALLGSWLVGGAGGIIGGSLASPFINALPITETITATAKPLGNIIEKGKAVVSGIGKTEKPVLATQRVLESQKEQPKQTLIDVLRNTFGSKPNSTDQTFTGSF